MTFAEAVAQLQAWKRSRRPVVIQTAFGPLGGRPSRLVAVPAAGDRALACRTKAGFTLDLQGETAVTRVAGSGALHFRMLAGEVVVVPRSRRPWRRRPLQPVAAGASGAHLSFRTELEP